MTEYKKILLGRGISFPLRRSNSGGLEYSEEINRINQSLFILFETMKGSRLMMPEFGSDIYKYKFDPLDGVLMEKLRYTITRDVDKWEPRISLTTVEFLVDDNAVDNNTLYISINYKLINTDVLGNYVYPYKMSTYNTLDLN